MAETTWTADDVNGNTAGATTRTKLALEKADNTFAAAQAGANGGLAVEGVAGGTPVPVSGTVTVDTSALATETTVDEMTGASVAASATGEITKSDATEYSPPLKVIWATGAGVITVMLADDTTSVIAVPVDANEKLTMFRIKKVMSTGTTATGIYGAK